MGDVFAEDTRVEAVGAGRYAASIDEAWNLLPLPQGGIVTALAVRAMTAELGDADQQLRALHTTYVAQVTHGPVSVDVEVLRRGRSMSHLRAEVRDAVRDGAKGAAGDAPGRRGHVTTAVFGTTRRGPSFTDLEPPDAPPPLECPSWRDMAPPEDAPVVRMRFWQERVEGRNVLGHAPWEVHEPGRAERVMWYGFDDPPMRDDGTLDPLALVVVADTMPGAVGQRTSPDDGMWFAPSVDLTVHLFGECRSSWLLAHNRARHAGDGYASADMALWDRGPDGTEHPRLVAWATQVMFFTYPDG